MRYEAVEFIGAGAGGMQRVLRPVVIELLGAALADHHNIAETVRKQRLDEIVFEGDSVIVDLADGFDVCQPGAAVGELLRQKIWCLLVRAVLVVPDDVVRLELAAVMVFDAVPQMDDPALMVAWIDLPRCGETGLYL